MTEPDPHIPPPQPPANPGDAIMQLQRAYSQRLVLLQHNKGQPIRIWNPAAPKALKRALAKAAKKARRQKTKPPLPIPVKAHDAQS